jgi:hypothetical protein
MRSGYRSCGLSSSGSKDTNVDGFEKVLEAETPNEQNQLKKGREAVNLPEPQSLTFSSLMSDIEKGIIKIPQFQRDFVRSKDKSAKLLDSIVKGYPIGTFIFWKTKEELRALRNLGGLNLPPTPEGDYIQYVLAAAPNHSFRKPERPQDCER